jgi:hypothetical protein
LGRRDGILDVAEVIVDGTAEVDVAAAREAIGCLVGSEVWDARVGSQEVDMAVEVTGVREVI